MKSFLATIALQLLLYACFAQADPLSISVEVKVDTQYIKAYSKKEKYTKKLIRANQWEVKSDSLKQQFFDIAVLIRNTSDTIISIYLPRHSWQDHFIVNNNYMYISETTCYHDIPDDLI